MTVLKWFNNGNYKGVTVRMADGRRQTVDGTLFRSLNWSRAIVTSFPFFTFTFPRFALSGP
jgi:hypothetical protein